MFVAAIAFWIAFSYKPYIPVSFSSINHLEKANYNNHLSSTDPTENLDYNNNQQHASNKPSASSNHPSSSFSLSNPSGSHLSSGPNHSQSRPEHNPNSIYHSKNRHKYLSKVPKFDALTSTLKDSLDPRDIFQDAVHNFSNRYSPYVNTSTQDDDDLLLENDQMNQNNSTNLNGNSRDEEL